MSNNSNNWRRNGGGHRDDGGGWGSRPRHAHGNDRRDNYNHSNGNGNGNGGEYGRGRNQHYDDRSHNSNGSRSDQYYSDRNNNNDSRRREETDRKPPPEERDAKKHKLDDPVEQPTAPPPAAAKSAATSTSTTEQPVLVTETDYEDQYIAAIRDQDKSTTHVPRQAFVVKEGHNEIEQRKAAARKVLEELQKITSNPTSNPTGGCQYDTPDSGDDSAKQNKGPVLTQTHRKFILALPYCVPLDAGFNVISCRIGDDEHCSCPCGPMLKPWREEQLGIQFDSNEKCEKKSFTPNALMVHLNDVGGVYTDRTGKHPLKDIYHYGARLYLKYLYSDWHSNIRVGHRALYRTSQELNRKAVNEERRVIMNAYDKVNKELIAEKEEKSKLEEKAREKEAENQRLRQLSDDQVKKLQRYENDLKKLNVTKKARESTPDSVISGFKTMAMYHFNSKIQDLAYKSPVQITVEESNEKHRRKKGVGFSIQDFFDKLYGASVDNTRLVLFGDHPDSKDDNKKKGVDNKIDKLIVSTWEVTYKKEAEYVNEASKKEDTGKDEGGPTRQFLTDLFKQLDTLSVKVGKKKKVKIFQNKEYGLVPIADDYLNEKIKSGINKLPEDERGQISPEEIIKRAKVYVRAIGRIMLHSLCYRQIMPNNAIAAFFMKVIFHGYNESYHKDDVLKHIDCVWSGKKEKAISDLIDPDKFALIDPDSFALNKGNALTAETIFSWYIPTKFIHSRKILLSGLIDGLTFGGKEIVLSEQLEKGCGLASLLTVMPFDAVQKIWFAKPKIELEDVKKILKPVYKIIDDDQWEGGERDRASLIELQRDFYYDVFMKYLEDTAQSDETFLQKFVECTTGFGYLPFDVSNYDDSGEKFEIKIEFDHKFHPMGYPHFHTCSKEAVLPASEASYIFCGYKEFRKKMNMAIQTSYNKFDME